MRYDDNAVGETKDARQEEVDSKAGASRSHVRRLRAYRVWIAK
jgi:hypothetical protein